jgi:uncharacterized protein YyaL (SSP411 family)
MTEPAHRNRLANETSPYLLQHASNPVDWYPWSTEALERARREEKPILLSIGYSACHWCHVMEHESFENESIAQLMNENFVNIKVDREERPDLDQIYMSAVQLMTGGGGWPLTVFLTPDGEPFYGGTYFPPEDQYNRPGFRRVLAAISQAYRERQDDVAANARKVIDQISRQAQQTPEPATPDVPLLETAAQGIAARFDAEHGGFGPAPKFPSSMAIEFLLRMHDRTGASQPLEMANLSLEKMALGGLYDQVGGGFHRYSTDERWLVPHFEKMLYDNALLVRVYLDAFRLTGNVLYRKIVEETVDFVARELRDAAGGFYSTLDADSEGVEGKFYVWNASEFRAVVGSEAELLARYFDVTDEGNFEGQNILNVSVPLEQFATRAGMEVEALSASIAEARSRLFERRAGRVRPGRDEKILTDWNGLMLRACAEAAASLGRADYREIAEQNARFLLGTMWDGRRLLHAFKDGQARLNGYLDDYANLADGLLALYELTFDSTWLDYSVAIAERMIEEFSDTENGGFFFTGKSHETLVARTKEFFDNATPSGNSVAADLLMRLGVLFDREDFRTQSRAICQCVADYVRRFPSGFGYMLRAVDFQVGPSRELALVPEPGPFLDVVRSAYLPRIVLAAGKPDSIPLLAGHATVDGRPTAYLCQDYVCHAPTTDPEELARVVRSR